MSRISLACACLVFLVGVIAAQQSVYMTVAYCPTPYTGAGAVVKIIPSTGAYSIVGKFGMWRLILFGILTAFRMAKGDFWLHAGLRSHHHL
jgi:hypothetical protein